MRKEKICSNCGIIHRYSTKLCQNCAVTFRKYGTFDPIEWKITCGLCGEKFFYKLKNAKYCPECRQKNRLITYKKPFKKNDSPKPKRKDGQGTITHAGYKYITRVGHPNSYRDGKIGEHTFIMSEFLGRPLSKQESIHHKNGIRHDNRIENLELWSRFQPSGSRVEDKIEWCKQFLEHYGYSIIKDAIKKTND